MNINAFVSHRCKEYDKTKLRDYLEYFLRVRELEPTYGCELDLNELTGNIPNSIQNAITRSEIYIAVVTESWKDVTQKNGWPLREWNLWKSIHHDDQDVDFCFGFFTTKSRESAEFIKDEMRIYPISKLKSHMFNTLLLGDTKNGYFINNEHRDIIDNLITNYKNLIIKARPKKKILR